MPPFDTTILDHLAGHGVETVGVGKIGDIFCERGIRTSYHDKGNTACLARTLSLLEEKNTRDRFVFVNLVDTDMYYGHRRDPVGYLNAVTEIDSNIPAVIDGMGEEDILVITADHGCDPTFKGTDHTREYVPVLWYSPSSPPVSLGIRRQFCDVASTISVYFGAGEMKHGEALFAADNR